MKIRLIATILLVLLFGICAKYVFRQKTDDVEITRDVEIARIVLDNTLFCIETIKNFYEIHAEIDKGISAIVPNFFNPNSTLNENKNMSRLRIQKMCELQLKFDDIKIELINIKSNCRNTELEKLICLAELLSNHCEECAYKDDCFINNKQYNNSLLYEQIKARVDKEVYSFRYEIQRILIKFKPFLSEDEKEGFKLNIEEKFKKEIDKYWNQRSKVGYSEKIFLFHFEWLIIFLYLNAN